MEQTKLPVNDDVPQRSPADPIVKWAGGKRWLSKYLAPVIHQKLAATGGRYIEPFLGGGAIALALGLPGMILGDACEDLIVTYRAVREVPDAVYSTLRMLGNRGMDREAYLKVRASAPTSGVVRAARFLYLNATCFNGLYRVNSHGRFNVPYGDRGDDADKILPSLERLKSCAAALKTSALLVDGYQKTLDDVREGDVVFVDPPYDGPVFDTYTATGFDANDQRALAERLRILVAGAGAFVVATNADTARVRDLYSWAYVYSTGEQRSVGAGEMTRGRTACLLMSNDASLISMG